VGLCNGAEAKPIGKIHWYHWQDWESTVYKNLLVDDEIFFGRKSSVQLQQKLVWVTFDIKGELSDKTGSGKQLCQ
jgi:hypothetical protein